MQLTHPWHTRQNCRDHFVRDRAQSRRDHFGEHLHDAHGDGTGNHISNDYGWSGGLNTDTGAQEQPGADRRAEATGQQGAADHRGDWMLGIAERFLQRVQLGLHLPPGIGRQAAREPLGRSVRAVGGGEGVVDVEVAQRGEAIDRLGVVLLLATEEAGILQKRDVAGLQAADDAYRASLGGNEAPVIDGFTIGIGIIIGGMVVSLYMPIFSIYGELGNSGG